jgi:replicative DNA helicase
MPANPELQLISMIVETGDMKTPLSENITVDIFGNAEARTAFKFLLNKYQGRETRNTVPDWDSLHRRFPAMEFPPPTKRMSLKSLCVEIREDYMRRKLTLLQEELPDLIDRDPQDALDRLNKDIKTLQITASVSDDITLSGSMEEMKREYEMAKNEEGYLGIPYPMGWGRHDEDNRPKIDKRTGRQDHPLNEQTRGMQKGELIVIYGRPKSMKTWLMVDMMVECYLHQHARVLCFSKEMSPAQIRTRTVARILGFDYLSFRNGQLSPEEEREFYAMTEELEQTEQDLKKSGYSNSLLITTGWGGKTEQEIAAFRAKIDEFEPDIVFLDAAYRMQTETKDWIRDMVEIVRGLKRSAQQYHVPVVITTQANRKGEESRGGSLAELAFSDAFGQECDLAMRIIKLEKDEEVVKLACIIAGAREIKLPGFLLDVKLARQILLEQVFASPRQIQALFKAEEEQAALEEDREAKAIRKKNYLADLDKGKGRQR